jgi:phosphatidylglycerol lysyltransferase
VLGLALLALAAAILRHEFRTHDLHEIRDHLRSIDPRNLLAALGLAAASYATLTGYDTLAFRYIRHSLPYRQIALSSFVAYVFSHNIGLSVFGGSAVRFRVLSGWHVKADDIARVIAFTMLTFWMGFFFLGGVVHTLWPLPISLADLSIPTSRPIGWLLLGTSVVYVAIVSLRRAPILVHGFRIVPPSLPITAAQLAVSSVDWLLAASSLYVLLPEAPGFSLPILVGAYLLSQILGLVSHVPGGLGVFETAMVVLLKPWLPGDQVLASIVAYRIIYYLVPFAVAVVLFAGFEIRQRRNLLERTSAWVQSWMAPLVPRFFAVTIFLSGSLLLVSGATPEVPDRLLWLRRALPLPLIELSNLMGSIIGVGLLLLANALRQRLDAGYVGTLLLLAGGAVASLVKGLDWEEASLLSMMALLLIPCHRFFYRRSSLLAQPLSLGWWLSAAVAAVGSIVVFELAYRHVEYSNELWWHFDHAAQAPRSLRATFGAGVALLAVGALRLLRPAPPVPELPTPRDLDRAQVIASKFPRTTGYLALLGDKEILFHEHGSAFLMYGVSGRTWIAMGDPIGSATEQEDLAWRFTELADRHGARAIFYEVSEQALPLYLDLGLDLHKLGEEGRVPLQDFSLEGSHRKGLRSTQNRMAREQCRFEVVPPDRVPDLLDELEAISNAWLAEKRTREKRFSLGFFDRNYLERLPVAIVRRANRIVAFANVWPSEMKLELTIDLMRYDENAPPGVMEFLFTQLMLWGRMEGYQYFGLGVAPLSGFEEHRLAPLWNRIGALLFRHGEHFYNFQGLRDFKEKFDPEWEPRYLAAPGGLTTPLVLTRIAALISGGASGVVSR